MKTVFVVEDEQSIQELYLAALKNAQIGCRCFYCADELFCALKNEIPDLFILDIMLDGMNGFEILAQLKKNAVTANIPVIMVSAKNEEIAVVKGLDLGADDYIKKPFGVMELVARINAKLKNTENKFEYKDLVIDDEKHIAKANGKQLFLTLKEYNLLSLLAKNAEKVLSREILLEKVWGSEYYGETRTLDIHIAQLRKKLAETNSVTEIYTIRGVGYSIE
ncbi:MAG TPA: response regulator transcription factor [Clostridia bacterium]|nr:response regulator transcription factor [Clostridia bacterium]